MHKRNLHRPPTDFTGATFAAGLDCEKADFHGAVSFNLADCGLASFKGARFLHKVSLKDNTKIDPKDPTKKILLERPPADFTAATFRSLDCEQAEFRGAVSFRGTECAARASFQNALFSQWKLLHDEIGTLPDEIGRSVPVDFTGASFGYLNCFGAHFKGAVSFNGLKCAGDAVFKSASFDGPQPKELETEELKKPDQGEQVRLCLDKFDEKFQGLRKRSHPTYDSLRENLKTWLEADIEKIRDHRRGRPRRPTDVASRVTPMMLGKMRKWRFDLRRHVKKFSHSRQEVLESTRIHRVLTASR